MISNTFLLRPAHDFRTVFLRFHWRERITRQQVLFLCYLIGRGFNKDFRTCDLVTEGLSWGLAKAYLVSLYRIGYLSRKGPRWSVTDPGGKFYSDFISEYNRIASAPFRWR